MARSQSKDLSNARVDATADLYSEELFAVSRDTGDCNSALHSIHGCLYDGFDLH